jgi:hypothetical protein
VAWWHGHSSSFVGWWGSTLAIVGGGGIGCSLLVVAWGTGWRSWMVVVVGSHPFVGGHFVVVRQLCWWLGRGHSSPFMGAHGQSSIAGWYEHHTSFVSQIKWAIHMGQLL